MLKLQTENPALLAEREKAKNYLLNEILGDSTHNSELIDDLINMTEGQLNGIEMTEDNIYMAYSKIYAPGLKDVIPEHMLKVGTMRVVK